MKSLLIPTAVLASAPAIAQDFDPRDPITGNGILSICSQGDPVSRTACGLYVRGHGPYAADASIRMTQSVRLISKKS